MTTGPVRLAIVGVGDVAARDYLPEADRLDGAEIVAVCGAGAQRVREIAERYDIPAWHAGLASLLAAADTFDAIVNLTPMQAHEEVTAAALRHGKHVYTEKPVASSVDGAIRLRQQAADAGVTLVCAPSVLLFPQVLLAGDLIADGALGAPTYARAHVSAGIPPWSGYHSDPSQFFSPGGGPALDLAVYPLHVITGLLGPAIEVAARSVRTRPSFTVDDGPFAGRRVDVLVDDNWEATLRLQCGALVSVNANYAVHGSLAPGLELHGEAGSIALDPLDVAAPVATLDAASGRWRETIAPHTRAEGPDHILGVAHLVDCVRAGRDPVAGVDHAIHVLDVLERAEESARTGRVQRLDTAGRRPWTP